MKKLSFLLTLAFNIAHAYPPLREQLPANTHAYFHTADAWQWLALGDAQAQTLAAPVADIKSALQQQGFINVPTALAGMGQAQLKYLTGGVEWAWLGDNMDTVAAFEVANETSALALAQAWLETKVSVQKRHNGAKRFVAQSGNQAACAEYADGRLLWAEPCALLDNLKGAVKLPVSIAPEGSEWLVFNTNNLWFKNANFTTQMLAQALELEKVSALQLSYSPTTQTFRATLHHQSAPLKALLSGSGASAAFTSLPEVQSALVFPVPSAAAVMKLAPAVLVAVEQELKQAHAPVHANQLLDALAGQWALVQENGQWVALWAGDGAKFEAVVAQLAQAGLVKQSALAGGITHLSYLKQTQQPDALIAATLLPTDIYYRDNNGVREFASLPQILTDRANANTPLQAFGAKPQSALWYGVRVPQLEKGQYYLRLKWLRYLAERAGQPFDVASLPSASEQTFAPQSPLLFQLYHADEGAVLEIQFAHGAFDALAWLSEQSPYGGVASMGILAAIALPAYQDYVSKTQLSHVMRDLGLAKTSVDAALFEGKTPNVNAELGKSPYIPMWGVRGFENGSSEGYVFAEIGGKANRNLHGVEIRVIRQPQGSWQCEIHHLTQPRLKPNHCTMK